MNRPDALAQLERLRCMQLHAMVVARSEADRLDLHRNVLALEEAVRALQTVPDDSTQTKCRGFKVINSLVEAVPEVVEQAMPFPWEADNRIRYPESEDVADRRWVEKRTARAEGGHHGRERAQQARPGPQEPQLPLF
jgi:hypothetical protein